MDNGIDKAQAETAVREYQYSQKQVESFYPVQMEDAEQFMRAGYTLKFLDKPDFSASVKMGTVDDRVITSKVLQNRKRYTPSYNPQPIKLTSVSYSQNVTKP